jgi:hypothetical protein
MSERASSVKAPEFRQHRKSNELKVIHKRIDGT